MVSFCLLILSRSSRIAQARVRLATNTLHQTPHKAGVLCTRYALFILSRECKVCQIRNLEWQESAHMLASKKISTCCTNVILIPGRMGWILCIARTGIKIAYLYRLLWIACRPTTATAQSENFCFLLVPICSRALPQSLGKCYTSFVLPAHVFYCFWLCIFSLKMFRRLM